jgi:tRNA(fMet)-specific endonuclease VapC
MHLLDTDTITHLQLDHPRVVQKLRELGGAPVGTTIITRIEMLRGRFDAVVKAASAAELLGAHTLLIRTEQFLNRMRVVPLGEVAAAHFERFRAIKRLKKVGRADLLIACIALAHEATLVTRNVRHFRLVPNLHVTNWVD